jgi:molybdopterin synthase catalytic subunit
MARMSDTLAVSVTAAPLSVDAALAAVADPGAGGTCVFVGTVRDSSSSSSSGDGVVTGLTYEAWDDLAVRRLTEIGEELFGSWPLRRVAIQHRTGELAVGEASVVIAVSAAHRAEAFEACRQAIERLKQDVPIWKKEGLRSGEAHWVMGS